MFPDIVTRWSGFDDRMLFWSIRRNAGGDGGATGGNSGCAIFGGNSSVTRPNLDNVSNHSGAVAAGANRRQSWAILPDANPRPNRAQ